MSNRIESCPICGTGNLHSHVGKEDVEYKGCWEVISLSYSVCDVCGSEQADASQTRQNKRAMLAFKKKVNGLLTGTQIKELRSRLGINQRQAAAIFGGGPVAFSKYENDDVIQSEAMDRLLRVADEIPAAFKYLARKAGIHLTQKVETHLAQENPSSGWIIVFSKEAIKTEVDKRQHLKLIHSSPPERTLRYG